jgi:type IV secretion system protein VirB10
MEDNEKNKAETDKWIAENKKGGSGLSEISHPFESDKSMNEEEYKEVEEFIEGGEEINEEFKTENEDMDTGQEEEEEINETEQEGGEEEESAEIGEDEIDEEIDGEEKNSGELEEEKIIDVEEEEKEQEKRNDMDYGQVETNLFGFVQKDENEEIEEAEGGEKNTTERGGTKKLSFNELRNNRKVPRLKKNLVLTIVIGGTMLFLVTLNVLGMKKEEEKISDVRDNESVETGGRLNLSGLTKRTDRAATDRLVEEAEREAENSYTIEQEMNDALRNNRNGTGWKRQEEVQNGAVAVDPSIEEERIRREQQAMGASLRKEGGYGQTGSGGSAGVQGRTDNGTAAGGLNFPAMMTKDEYMNSQLSSLASLTGQGTGNNGNNGRFSDNGAYDPNNKGAGNFEFFEDNVIFPGTIIHAVLVSRIDTDYPGPIHARVSENVYDSKTGKNLLIPQGTILQGNYSSSSIGVAKVQIAWESMVVNFNGVAYQVSLGGMAGVDKRGRSGIAGTLDDHYFEWLKAAGIVSLFTMMNSEIAYQTKNTKNKQVLELMDTNQGLVNNLADRIMERALDIQPTVRVANGKAVSVAVNKAVVLRPFKAFEAEQKYIRGRRN